MRRFLMSLLVLAFVAGLVVFGAVGWWLHEPLTLKPQPGSQVLDLEIEPGTPAQRVAEAVAASGADVPPVLLYAWFRLSGQARQIKAGSYEITPGTTPRMLLSMLVRGEESLKSVTLVEGWNFRQVRAALQKAEALKPDTQGLGAEAIMAQLGKPGVHPEGRFFPDTYTYAKGSSDLAVLKRAARAMDKRLEAAWALRSPDTPLKTPDEALILASIVEKETGKPSDRPEIGGVFSNRLRIGMMLQTDPTVIYGLGEQFDGNLRKRDLQADTPYNTYTRTGLPPTPIAMPGKAALLAAVQPAQSKALYFVARGDGTSHFSSSLDEHNRAVNKFQRGQ
ncbi:MAG TPA: endolytic transglycosylase MltG [Polaromonas sp.]|uniref:endolytic transglycosylase MltG n=1 Tax=unclassified Polaromonas TaxID=2638319 RepID=UPI000BD5C160|nr:MULTISPECIES: endolytic transglycosylase MltG [unclassified Polaromonas]OYY39288.1 MAG: aminodeoxychorismate lyase [Polaromonas sp. 35-63-35]OYZ20387.1 MAG: aminodeoxychorismate lyase [Polaromonas sp. 16-63-31]OYZ80594.1 MAG: aminodeoxychorismate lyase [Polaromonas sp. 24-63-21]OZA51655.1 MAG: aminodeoxychorismate lyase [Polaromonas sp. 17-63-33]OZA89874.1 MAG: aminodeoxychorismate lyase [Polaromonas sp. 39-63-25]